MMHLNRLGLPPQQSDILLESLRAPESHMSLLTSPPNSKDSRLPLDALILNNLMRDTIRAAQVAGGSGLLFEPSRCLGSVGEPFWDGLGVAVESCDFGHRGAESFCQSARGLEVDVVDLGVGGHDGAEALDEGLVGGRGHEGFVVLAGVPVLCSVSIDVVEVWRVGESLFPY